MLLIRLGFEQGKACPNVFFHRSRDISCSVHGDDFTSSGPADAPDWLETEVGREYGITVGPRLGPGPNDAKEARALNRVVRWLDDRIEYEADPRQAERLMAECGLDGCKSMTTPGVQPTFRELEEDQELQQRLHTAFRGASARGNYLSADRVDCQFACKEICRWMAKPTAHSWKSLKRLCRYLAGSPRLVYVYRKQKVDCVDIYTDTNWAGCPKTRKSTSGGAVLLGQHTIKHWSSTQTSVALSSGEAEFNGVVRGAGQGLGYQALLGDLGVSVPLRLWTDSSAAIGICSRQGLGKLRHLDAHMPWIQQAVRSGRVDLRKVDGERNPADLLTKHSLTREKLQQLTKLYDCHFLEGRAQSAPQMRPGASGKVTMAEAEDGISAVNSSDQRSYDRPGEHPLQGIPAEALAAHGEEGDEGIESWMPHKVFDKEELDERFPSLRAPEAEDLEDPQQDEGDAIYTHGMAIAADIVKDMSRYGRIRSRQKMREVVKDVEDHDPSQENNNNNGKVTSTSPCTVARGGDPGRWHSPGGTRGPRELYTLARSSARSANCSVNEEEKNEPNNYACGALRERPHRARTFRGRSERMRGCGPVASTNGHAVARESSPVGVPRRRLYPPGATDGGADGHAVARESSLVGVPRRRLYPPGPTDGGAPGAPGSPGSMQWRLSFDTVSGVSRLTTTEF